MTRALSFSRLPLLAMLGLASCYTWVHAPGYAERGALAHNKLRFVRGEACSERGLCDREGSAGVLRVAMKERLVDATRLRSATSFRVTYAGQALSCEHPGAGGAVLSCAQEGEHPLRLEMGPGCERGTLSTEAGTFVVATDRVDIGGKTFFGQREVSVHDPAGHAVAFVDFAGYDYDVFGPTAAGGATVPLSTVETVAAALGAFYDSEGIPEGCWRALR